MADLATGTRVSCPPDGPFTVTTTTGGVHIAVDDPATWAAFITEAVRLARGNRAIALAHPEGPPRYDIDPVIADLKRIREQAGATRRTVAEAMLMDRGRVAAYERGALRPRIDVVTAWAYVLGRQLAVPPLRRRRSRKAQP